MKSSELYFILSSSCKLVKGYSRSVIVDYVRADIYFIPNQYYSLLKKLDRRKLGNVMLELDDAASKKNFREFVDFLTGHGLGFFTAYRARFPRVNEEEEEDHFHVQDAIIEIDELLFKKPVFSNFCREIAALLCEDFQLRLLSDYNETFVKAVIDELKITNCNYLELHCTYNQFTTQQNLHRLIENTPLLFKVIVYGAPEVKKYPVINKLKGGQDPFVLGEAWFVNYPFEKGQCCGIINFENLDFSDTYAHNRLKKRNGCLYKKITLDANGYIKNCPSMKETYGRIGENTLAAVLKNKKYREYGDLHKDQIETCKICEFRYNCTDCRAFITDPENIYSKPARCSYNPVTCTWEQ